MSQVGIVYIIGAGPGDPELITVRGLNCLRQADVVAYDRLIDHSLLAEAPALARLIDVGKAPGHQRYRQVDIHRLLIREARHGQTVVRLKGGDPFVFGRGGEECQALREAGIPFEVVPGVSSAIAAPAFAGIPITHRNLARSFTVVTGHTAGDSGRGLETGPSKGIDWQALARLETLIFLMGVSNLAEIRQQLIAHGRAPETPVAVVSCATTRDQRVVYSTLEQIIEAAEGVRAPATIIVGTVVELGQALEWFEPDGKFSSLFAASGGALSATGRLPQPSGAGISR